MATSGRRVAREAGRRRDAACEAARRGGDGCGAGEGVQGGSCVASSNTSPLPMLGSGNLGGGCDV